MALLEPLTPEPAPRAIVVPDGIPAAARTRASSPRQVLAATAIGAAVLALLASGNLPSWAEQLRDGPLTPTLRNAATVWNRDLERLGLAAPHRALRRSMRWMRDRQWP